jgi:TetR/AcrR family transcriptional regulator, ethionamide resistance regulator
MANQSGLDTPPAPRAAADREDRRRRREQIRADVLRVALELADQAPFRDLTVDEIARAAGISRSAFYTHFRDKHDLLRVAVEDVADQLYVMADRWWHGEGPPGERVRVALEGVVSVYAEHAALLRIAVEVSTYDEEVRELWLTIVGRFIDATAEHIRSEQAKGLIQQALEPRATAECLVWMNERVSYIYLGRGERRPEEAVEAMAPVWAAALYPGVIPAEQLRPASLGPSGGSQPSDAE